MVRRLGTPRDAGNHGDLRLWLCKNGSCQCPSRPRTGIEVGRQSGSGGAVGSGTRASVARAAGVTGIAANVLLAALYVVERRACAFYSSADAVQSGPGGRHVAKVVG